MVFGPRSITIQNPCTEDWKGETAVMESHFEIDASRGGKILTNTVFDMSRDIMEMLPGATSS